MHVYISDVQEQDADDMLHLSSNYDLMKLFILCYILPRVCDPLKSPQNFSTMLSV